MILLLKMEHIQLIHYRLIKNSCIRNVLKYTGEKQTQEVEQVLVNGKALNKEDYEVLDNQATKEGKHVLTIKAKGNNHTGS
ncbi:MAG: hypothetical protein ACLR43_03530 [Faecalibacillus faecis]